MKPVKVETDTVKMVGKYRYADILGKGGFGTVFRAFNMENGVTVAIKRVNKEDLDEEKLGSIESEVKLLKKLKHPNIVRYIETVRGPDGSLNIVLEYIENGSLSSILKKFGGKFSENLVAIYTTQVLKGLVYLHAQGVVHRDIKGANILATKEGIIKLADFGVASESGEVEGVVGTPYWMAPEIIEMTGHQGTACDIWSVGCTVIELITGSPPYFDLNPMPALFRIVQDEHPPLPDNISMHLKEFLLACFQKDPNLRVSAEKLLDFKWLKSPQKMMLDDDNGMIPDADNEANEIVQQTIILYKKLTFTADYMEQMTKNKVPEPITILSPAKKGAPTNLAPVKFSPNNQARQLQSPNIKAFKEEDEDDMSAFDDVDDVPPIKLSLNPQPTSAAKHVSKPSLLVPMKHFEPIPKSYMSSLSSELNLKSDTSTPTTQSFTSKLQTEKPSQVKNKEKPSYFEKEDDENFDDFSDIKIDINKFSLKKIDNWDEEAKNKVDNDAEFEFDNDDLSEGFAVEKYVAEVTRLIKQLSPKSEMDKLLDVIKRLEEIFVLEPQSINKLMGTSGVIPIMEMLEVNYSVFLLPLLKFVSKVIAQNSKFSQSLCLVGLVPAIIKLAGAACPDDIRVEAANYIKHFCGANDFTRKMFIACGGFPVLVQLLEKDYARNEKLALLSIDCILLVFQTSSNPKNDFYRLFCKFDLLRPLAVFYQSLITKVNDDYSLKVAKIFHMFSQGDNVVKVFIARRNTSKILLSLIDKVSPEQLNLLVKTFRHLSMDDSTLDLLETSEIIQRLVPVLSSPMATAEVSNQILMTMHYLCKIKASRQETMANAGLIPHLLRFIKEDHPLKQFALPILKSLATCSPNTRLELRKQGGLEFFIYLLEQLPYWRAVALDAIFYWITDNPNHVDLLLTQPQNLSNLVGVLSGKNSAVAVLPKLNLLLSKLNKTSRAIGSCSSFVGGLLSLLKVETSAIARKPILMILSNIFDNRITNIEKKKFVARHSLIKAMSEVASNDEAVLVQDLANELLEKFKSEGIVI